VRRASMAIAMLQRLDLAGIRYVIVRNVDPLVAGTFGDVDVVIEEAAELSRALHALAVGARSLGLVVYRQSLLGHSGSLGVVDPRGTTDGEHPPIVWFDVFASFAWRGIPYLRTEEVLARRRFHPAGVWHTCPSLSALATLMHYVLYAGEVPLKYRAWLENSLPSRVDPALAACLQASELETLASLGRAGSWSELARRSLAVRRTLLLRALCQPRGIWRTFAGYAAALLVALRKRPGAVAVVPARRPSEAGSGRALVAATRHCHAFSPIHSVGGYACLGAMPRIWWATLNGGLVAVTVSSEDLSRWIRILRVVAPVVVLEESASLTREWTNRAIVRAALTVAGGTRAGNSESAE
jgi:hypothetical protein